MRFGGGKTEYQCQLFHNRMPLKCGEQEIRCTECNESLGIAIDSDLRMTTLMKRVEHRGHQSWQLMLNAVEALGLPYRVSLLALRLRVQPRCCFGAEFLIIRPDWRARLDRLQDSWAMSLLGLEDRQPRVALLREMGDNFRFKLKNDGESNRFEGQARHVALRPHLCESRQCGGVVAR